MNSKKITSQENQFYGKPLNFKVSPDLTLDNSHNLSSSVEPQLRREGVPNLSHKGTDYVAGNKQTKYLAISIVGSKPAKPKAERDRNSTSPHLSKFVGSAE